MQNFFLSVHNRARRIANMGVISEHETRLKQTDRCLGSRRSESWNFAFCNQIFDPLRYYEKRKKIDGFRRAMSNIFSQQQTTLCHNFGSDEIKSRNVIELVLARISILASLGKSRSTADGINFCRIVDKNGTRKS